MFRPERDVEVNTAAGIAVVLGLITFCVSFVACIAFATFYANLLPFYLFEPAPPATWRERVTFYVCVAVPCLISWLVARQAFRFFRIPSFRK